MFQLLPIAGITSSTDQNSLLNEDEEHIIDSTNISEENFLLVILLTSRANLIVYYRTGCSSRLETFSIGKFFSSQKHKLPSPVLLTLTEDASVLIVLLENSQALLLIPFRSIMDVTWGRRSNTLVHKPTIFTITSPFGQSISDEGEETGGEEVQTQTNLPIPSTALCFQSKLSQRTYLLFGTKEGTLFIIDLQLKRVNLRIDLRTGIRNLFILQTYPPNGQKEIMVTLFDSAQLLLPLEAKNRPLRETLASLSPSQICTLHQNLQFFPQKNGEICVLDRQSKSLKVYKSFDFSQTSNSPLTLHSELIAQLEKISHNIAHILFTKWLVVVLTQTNKLLVHFRFLQSNYEIADFSPIEMDKGNFFHIYNLISTSNGSSSSATNGTVVTGGDGDGDQLDVCSLVTNTGLFWLRPTKSLNLLILEHISSHLFLVDYLISAAQCLRINPDSLCLSLLSSLLRLTQQKLSNDDETDAQVDGLISLAFVVNVNLSSLFSLLQEFGQADLLFPFLTIKAEKHPTDFTLRQLLLGAMLARLSKIFGSEEYHFYGDKENKFNEERKAKLNQEKDAIEYELRHFLIEYDVCESDVMPVLLRHQIWSCVCVLLSRNPLSQSAPVARYLLELNSWKSVEFINGLLRCLTFLHWPSLDSYAPVLAVKLFNLVPSLDSYQLNIVNAVTDALINKSIDSATSLKLVTSMRLYGLHLVSHTRNGNDQFSNQLSGVDSPTFSGHFQPLACGSNCCVVLAENGASSFKNQTKTPPLFWGEFTPGTTRLKDDYQSAFGGTKRDSMLVAKRHRENNGAERTTANLSPQHRRLTVVSSQRRKQEQRMMMDTFAYVPVPKPLQLPVVNGSHIEVRFVACGTEHILLASVDGRLFSYGRNRFGQCGTGNKSPVFFINEINAKEFGVAFPPSNKILGIYAGHYHSAFINARNEIWLWGWGIHGQLGTGGIDDKCTPSKSEFFTALAPCKSLCLGYAHTLALTTTGLVYGCGVLAHGQLGVDPTRDMQENPLKIMGPLWQLPFPSPIALISTSYFHGIALASNGRDLFEWGECPQTIRMRMFLHKRLRGKEKRQQTPNFASPKNVKSTVKDNNCPVSNEKIIADGDGNKDTSKGRTKEGKGDQTCEYSNLLAGFVIDVPRDHLRIRQVCEWNGEKIKMLSAGFNHSALMTINGDLYTWGKSLEMQLGHGSRKERSQPTKVDLPKGLNNSVGINSNKWVNVVCARNFTVGITGNGIVYVWGRNDKYQLGLGSTQKKPAGTTRRILLKSEKGAAQRAVELPVDNCIGQPTMLPGIRVPIQESPELVTDIHIADLLASSDQHSLNSLSRYLVRNPVFAFIAVQAHLMAGDFLYAIRTLIQFAKTENINSNDFSQTSGIDERERPVALITSIGTAKENLISKSKLKVGTLLMTSNNDSTINNNNDNGSASPQEQSSSPQISTTAAINSTPRRVYVQLKKTYVSSPISSSSTVIASSSTHQRRKNQSLQPSPNSTYQSSASTVSLQSPQLSNLEQFHLMVDRIWALLRIYPIPEVQTLGVLTMLKAHFPIYNRLAADLRMCRLIDPYIVLGSPNISTQSTSKAVTSVHSQRRLLDIGVRDRQTALRTMLLPDNENRLFKALKKRCAQMITQDRLRYFADCGHFEKCVVESGPARSEFASLKNRLRKCTRCVGQGRRRSSGSREKHLLNP